MFVLRLRILHDYRFRQPLYTLMWMMGGEGYILSNCGMRNKWKTDFVLTRNDNLLPLQVTNDGLQQGYCIVPSAKRFLVLYSFLKLQKSKKVMVFFSSCNSVKFHSDLLKFVHVECFDIHGQQKQQSRTSTFFEFCKADKGILLCTDVAARGLDIPAVVCFFPLLLCF